MAFDSQRILTALEGALRRSPADQTELVYIGTRDATTRFAENAIHQSMVSADGRAVVRLVHEGRVAVSSTNDLSDDGLDRAVTDALEIASFLDPDESFPALVKSETAPRMESFFPSTDSCLPQRRAAAVADVARMARDAGVQTSGLFRLKTNCLAVTNSAGTRQFHEETTAEFSVSAADDAALGQGWSAGVNHDIDKLDLPLLGRVAIDKAVRSRNPETIPAGEYTVILEPAAVGQLLLFLGFLAFSGKSFAQGRGIFTGRMGEQVTGTNITVVEDPFLAAHPGLPFDYEGVPKKTVVLIEKGIARGVVHDRRSAAMAGGESTGHALPADNARGPYPKNLTLLPGNASIEEMVSATERGLLITHFWYINYLNPMRTQVSGSTRDGTFLIEDGAVTKPVRNLRATPSILESFANADLIGRDRVLYPQYSAVMYIPPMRINGMPFVEDDA